MVLVFVSTGCHQIVIDSGLEPATTQYHEEWNIAYAYAIFPAQVDASQYCGGRWARVETKQSFLNWVVGAITFGIISPMESRVVCAAGQADGEEGFHDAPTERDSGSHP
jgi:hypothetical protein